MAISQVIFNNSSLIDLTQDTVTPESVLNGYTFHGSNGEMLTGNATAGDDRFQLLSGKQENGNTAYMYSNLRNMYIDYVKITNLVSNATYMFSSTNFNNEFTIEIEEGIPDLYGMFSNATIQNNIYIKTATTLNVDNISSLFYSTKIYSGGNIYLNINKINVNNSYQTFNTVNSLLIHFPSNELTISSVTGSMFRGSQGISGIDKFIFENHANYCFDSMINYEFLNNTNIYIYDVNYINNFMNIYGTNAHLLNANNIYMNIYIENVNVVQTLFSAFNHGGDPPIYRLCANCFINNVGGITTLPFDINNMSGNIEITNTRGTIGGYYRLWSWAHNDKYLLINNAGYCNIRFTAGYVNNFNIHILNIKNTSLGNICDNGAYFYNTTLNIFNTNFYKPSGSFGNFAHSNVIFENCNLIFDTILSYRSDNLEFSFGNIISNTNIYLNNINFTNIFEKNVKIFINYVKSEGCLNIYAPENIFTNIAFKKNKYIYYYFSSNGTHAAINHNNIYIQNIANTTISYTTPRYPITIHGIENIIIDNIDNNSSVSFTRCRFLNGNTYNLLFSTYSNNHSIKKIIIKNIPYYQSKVHFSDCQLFDLIDYQGEIQISNCYSLCRCFQMTNTSYPVSGAMFPGNVYINNVNNINNIFAGTNIAYTISQKNSQYRNFNIYITNSNSIIIDNMINSVNFKGCNLNIYCDSNTVFTKFRTNCGLSMTLTTNGQLVNNTYGNIQVFNYIPEGINTNI